MALFANSDTWAHIQSYFTPLETATMAEVCQATPKPSAPLSRRVRTIDLAARRGYKGIVKWRKSELKDETFIAAAKSGNLKLVKWFKKNKCYCCSKKAVKEAVKHGHLSILKWYAVNYHFLLNEKVLYRAARYNKLKVVKWFFWFVQYKRDEYNFGKVVEIAAEKRYDAMFKWCVKHQCKITQEAFKLILKSGDYKLSKLCVKYASHLFSVFAGAMYAAEGGNLAVLQLCVANGAKIERHYVLSRAIANNDLPMVQWLIAQGAEVDEQSVENAQKLSDQTIYNYLVSL